VPRWLPDALEGARCVAKSCARHITLNIVIFVLRITAVLRANTGGDPRWAAYWGTRV
jgi:hypothetical protein